MKPVAWEVTSTWHDDHETVNLYRTPAEVREQVDSAAHHGLRTVDAIPLYASPPEVEALVEALQEICEDAVVVTDNASNWGDSADSLNQALGALERVAKRARAALSHREADHG